jgi:tetratricopeptide (TPR) repeat protein
VRRLPPALLERRYTLARESIAWHRLTPNFPMPSVSQVTADPALESRLFWEKYKTTIIAVAAVLLLAGLGYAGFQLYTARQEANATALLASAHTAEQYQQVIDRYPGTEPAATAWLLLAAQQRQQKKYAEANATLHKFIERFPKHQMITTAWMGVGANLESLGKNDEALSTYQRLATEYPDSFSAPLALMAEVSILKAKGRSAEARKILETVMSRYRDNVLMSQALQELMSLPQPASAPAANTPPPGSSEPIPMERPPETPPPAKP